MINFNAITEYCKQTNACKLKDTYHSSLAAAEIKMKEQNEDVFCRSKIGTKFALQHKRDAYLKKNPEAFHTLDHIKSNYDNYSIMKSAKGQTKDLKAVSTKDFCDLSEIMKEIRLPFSVDVYRAMEPQDFNIGRITPEQFFKEYYKEGKEVVVPIYMSTSFDKNIAYRFAEKNPHRFIINLKVDKDIPAVYMEKLCPGDDEVYGHEQELNIIRNAKLVLGKVRQTVNPWDNQKIYELDAHVTGFVDVKPEPEPVYEYNEEDLELLSAIRDFIKNNQ